MWPLLNYQAGYCAACVRNMLFIFGVHMLSSFGERDENIANIKASKI